jgi:hypothetical protein
MLFLAMLLGYGEVSSRAKPGMILGGRVVKDKTGMKVFSSRSPPDPLSNSSIYHARFSPLLERGGIF